ncbi:hypothetical protein BDV25DRAFT_156660 [Aspergillus avenaceus]|uniref:Uncharacterized protein n=1 Tax=Aspergillus avenaceus TaxID=36643 RepID=A0A5N6TSC7_ASPAV|nr:hypothetical protein BDV25DRAFT_156660 [Aspergillus avenaceus]
MGLGLTHSNSTRCSVTTYGFEYKLQLFKIGMFEQQVTPTTTARQAPGGTLAR